jgi:putative addiction module component (TIGR02574 family)
MNATLETEIAKLTSDQKLNLIDRLWTDLDRHGPPRGVLSDEDPQLLAKLEKRVDEALADPTQRLTLAQFKASFGDR